MSAASQENVILRGGPENFPEHRRRCFVEDPQSVLKVPCGNRYEHFRRSTRPRPPGAGTALHRFED